MTWTRDLAWQNIEQSYRSSTTHVFARYALALDYKSLPPEVVHQAKRSLLDTLGVAIGAYDAPGRPICETVVKGLGGTAESTVFGSGIRTSAPNATLVNSFLIRFLDFNDVGGGAGHPSDAIGAILAVAEREKSNGRDYITSQIIPYELGARCNEALRNVAGRFESNTVVRPWAPDCMGALYMPPALGKLMGMNEEQIANAIGVCACHEFTLGIMDTDKEENRMSKNLRLGWTSYNSVLACLMAKNGFTGPIRVVEGQNGINQALFGDAIDFQKLFDFSGFYHLNTKIKALPVNITTIGHVLATLAVVNEHPIKVDDIASVKIIAGVRETLHCTAPAKKYPKNAESADHSMYWPNAMAIRDRSFGPESYKEENYTDPVILDLIEKITVEGDPKMPGHWLGGECQITTKEGRVFKKRIDLAHGQGNDPFTDAEIEEKFRKNTARYMNERQIKQIIDTVWNVEKLDDMGKLAKLMVFQTK